MEAASKSMDVKAKDDRLACESGAPADYGERSVEAMCIDRLVHDLNNMLVVVTSGLNLLEGSEDPGHREILVARMREAVARGEEISREISALGRGGQAAWIERRAAAEGWRR
jgi:hypothetical protein